MLKLAVFEDNYVLVGFYSTKRDGSYYRGMTWMETELCYRMEQCMAKWEEKRVHRRT